MNRFGNADDRRQSDARNADDERCRLGGHRQGQEESQRDRRSFRAFVDAHRDDEIDRHREQEAGGHVRAEFVRQRVYRW